MSSLPIPAFPAPGRVLLAAPRGYCAGVERAIDIAQGPVERAVGLARLVVHTASAGTDASIPGIAAGDAEGLRRLILARTGHGDAV